MQFHREIHTSSDNLIACFSNEKTALYKIPTSLETAENSLIPSFSCITEKPYSFCFFLKKKETDYIQALTHVGGTSQDIHKIIDGIDFLPKKIEEEPNIDFFSDIPADSELFILVCGVNLEDKAKSLLSVTSFSQNLEELPASDIISAPINVRAISQSHVDPLIGSRICSPVSTTMVLQSYGIKVDPMDFATLTYSSEHDLYGVWPQAIYSASRYGVLGMVTALQSYQELFSYLEKQIPVVATIGYQKDTLENAAIEETPGHLVVIKGLDENHIIVNDPASKTVESVERRYRKDEFAKAWFKNKNGVCYVFLRENCTTSIVPA